MNLFFVFADGSIQTPPLGGTILPGVTRNALLTLARAEGIAVREEPYAIDQWQADAKSGRLTEAFACGTGVTLAPIGSITNKEVRHEMDVSEGGIGPRTQMIRTRLAEVMSGRHQAPRYENWLHEVKDSLRR